MGGRCAELGKLGYVCIIKKRARPRGSKDGRAGVEESQERELSPPTPPTSLS